jgi:hypothetical protein
MSADGTIISGGNGDDADAGAAWIFIRYNQLLVDL